MSPCRSIYIYIIFAVYIYIIFHTSDILYITCFHVKLWSTRRVDDKLPRLAQLKAKLSWHLSLSARLRASAVKQLVKNKNVCANAMRLVKYYRICLWHIRSVFKMSQAWSPTPGSTNNTVHKDPGPPPGAQSPSRTLIVWNAVPSKRAP